MAKWEYKRIATDDEHVLDKDLAVHGADGWEAVGFAVYGQRFAALLKRSVAGENGPAVTGHLLDEFDWVAATAECSPARCFENLRKTIRHDVEQRNATRNNEPLKFIVDDSSRTDTISVLVEGANRPTVRFSLEDNAIRVANDNDTVVFTARPVINDFGQCRFEIDGLPQMEWELRKRALSPLFFGAPQVTVNLPNFPRR